MSNPVELKQNRAAKALRTASKLASNQALALNELFSQTVKEAARGDMRFDADMRIALKAQAQYRATLKILLALEKVREWEEKSRNSSERTVETENSPT